MAEKVRSSWRNQQKTQEDPKWPKYLREKPKGREQIESKDWTLHENEDGCYHFFLKNLAMELPLFFLFHRKYFLLFHSVFSVSTFFVLLNFLRMFLNTCMSQVCNKFQCWFLLTPRVFSTFYKNICPCVKFASEQNILVDVEIINNISFEYVYT